MDSVGKSPGRGSCHTSLPQNSFAASRIHLPGHPVGSYPGGGPCHASFNRHVHATSKRLQRCTRMVHLREGAPAAPPYICNAHAASGRHLLAHMVESSLGRGSCHTPLYQLACVASGCLLQVKLEGASPERTFVAPLSFERSMQPPAVFHLSGGPPVTPPYINNTRPFSWCTPQKALLGLPAFASHAASLPQLVRLTRRPWPCLSTSILPAQPPEVSCWRPQLVRLSVGSVPHPLLWPGHRLLSISVKTTPPQVTSYRCT